MDAKDTLLMTKLNLMGTAIQTVATLVNQKYAAFGDKSKGQVFQPDEAQKSELDSQINQHIADIAVFQLDITPKP